MSIDGIDLSSMSMLDIFQLEAENQCTVLSDGLLSLEQEPDSMEVLERLMRAAHSVKGAARIIGLDSIVTIAHEMEDVFVAAQEGRYTVTKNGVDTLFRGIDFLIDLSRIAEQEIEEWLLAHKNDADDIRKALGLLLVENGETQGSPPPQKVEPVEEVQEKTQETSDLTNVPMFELFQQELQSQILVLGSELKGLAKVKPPKHKIDKLLQAIQSSKGAAKIVEITDVVSLVDGMAVVFQELGKGNIVLLEKDVELVEKGLDILQAYAVTPISDLEKTNQSQHSIVQDLIDSYTELVSKISPVEIPLKKKVTTAKARPKVKNKKAGKKRDTVQDRSVRVSAEGLNRLMGLAGEVQVESRWMPDFSLKMLRLKHVQDDLYRMLQRGREQLSDGRLESFQNNTFIYIADKIELVRSLFNTSLMEVEDHARRTTEISHRLYHEVIANRMRPFGDGVKPFPRMVRDLASELGKDIKLEIVGEETKVDRDILEKIEAPLNHLIRNSVDHGIEMPEDREKAGKSRQATITLEARHSSGMLNILVIDDGKGIDLEKLRAKIVEKQMVTEEIAGELKENELLEFLFLPGFSTREKVSSVSGRGVGLDVVHSTVHEVRGIVRSSTVSGQGTTFEMQLPITLSVLRALMVEINSEAYAFPLVAIDHVLHLPKEQIKEVEGRPYITFNNERIGLVSARQVLGQSDDHDEFGNELLALIISDRHNSYGLIVDKFLGVRDLVVQPLDSRLGKLQDISAAAILEDGTPVLIVDVEDMVRSIDNLISGNRLKRIDNFEESDIGRRLKRILVADDSITVREVERKMLLTRGYEVDVAVDGMDAWNNLKNESYDLIVTDIDMPRMDGIELVTLVKEEENLRTIPVIIVSYKDREEDRQRGLEAGADYYLTKGSFQDETLVQAVEDLIGSPEEFD